MYIAGRADHYLRVGLSAIRCIRRAFANPDDLNHVRAVLDFPSGYGRVLRWLRTMFGGARISCGDIDVSALEFCSRTFEVDTVVSSFDVDTITIPGTFDLIWCGSLLTHLDEQRTAAFLRLFYRHLSDKGVCVFTMHGRQSLEWIKSGSVTYGLSDESQGALVTGFEAKGYGYASLDGDEYGISLAAPPWTDAAARLAGPWKRVLFEEQGWDNHQDVYAFGRA